MAEEKINDTTAPIPQPRHIPGLVSERARSDPQSIWASVPNSQIDASLGFEDVTFARLNYAITRAAKWIQKTIGPRSSLQTEALAYIGPPDTRYIIFTIAAIKTGFQMLFLSPRNSDEAQRSVIEQANCYVFLSSQSMEARIRRLLDGHSRLREMMLFVVPEQDELLRNEHQPDFPYERNVERARKEPLVVLHTSSTTGIPKNIPLNQGYGMHEDIIRHVPTSNGLDIITRKPFYGPCRMFVAMPLYHAGGVLLTLLKSLYHDIVSVFQPADVALTADVFDAILRYGRCTGCVIPPYLLEEMLTDPQQFDTLASLDFVQFGSGPLSQTAGEQLLTRQPNCPHFIGSSECGLYVLLELDDPKADWQYFRFHPWSGCDFRPIDDTGQIYELFIIRSEAPRIAGLQPVFELFPELDEWPTKDLYCRHPTKPDHWRCIGRNDDVLVLSNGEKLNPVDTEGRITNAHPSVTGVLVVGQGRFAPALLLEVRNIDASDAVERARLIADVWPLVEAANRDAPGHGRLSKELILLTTPDKPFLRTPKLSIRRKPTVDLYADEIEDMYACFVENLTDNDDGDLAPADFCSVDSIQEFICRRIQSETMWNHGLKPTDDFFMLGMDSLQAIRMTRAIRSALAKQEKDVGFDARVLYRHPTVKSLSEEIFRMIHSESTASGDRLSDNCNAIQAVIEEYTDFQELAFEVESGGTNGKSDRGLNVILTGSTGSLGSHILRSLLEKLEVAKVYCLNRTEDAKDRTFRMLLEQGVELTRLEELEQRVHFLHSTSLDKPHLGLAGREEYDLLMNANTTHIIHNAWPVNFNIAFSSFKPHIAGVRALVDFSVAAPKHPKIIFLSSLSSVTSLSVKQTIPEAVISDPSAPSPMGYGESKYVSEHILSRATEVSKGAISTAILRVGQIAGPVKTSNAAWPSREWLPSLVISSQTIGALPESLGRMDQVDWVPVDLLADSIVELLDMDSSGANESKVFHVINPNSTAWSELLPALRQETAVEKVVPLKDWIVLARRGPKEDSTSSRNPAKKILQFYEGLANTTGPETRSQRFELRNMAKASKTFQNLQPVSSEWFVAWAKKW